MAYIVSGLGSDSVTVIDASTWQVANAYSVGPSTRPQDIAVVSDQRAYVTRLTEASLLVVRPTAGQLLETVDLSPYADADGLPEPTWIRHVNGKVYVLLQRMTGLKPTDHSSLLVVDGATPVVEQELHLSAVNPYGLMHYSEELDALVITEVGNFGENDGGIEYFRPTTSALSGIAVSEQTLRGDILEAVIASATKGYAIVGRNLTTTQVVSFDPNSGQKKGELLTATGLDHVNLALSPDRSELWISDRSDAAPGIRIFDTATDQELTTAPLDVGLPPVQVCFASI
jgi:hypothetical protein